MTRSTHIFVMVSTALVVVVAGISNQSLGVPLGLTSAAWVLLLLSDCVLPAECRENYAGWVHVRRPPLWVEVTSAAVLFVALVLYATAVLAAAGFFGVP